MKGHYTRCRSGAGKTRGPQGPQVDGQSAWSGITGVVSGLAVLKHQGIAGYQLSVAVYYQRESKTDN